MFPVPTTHDVLTALFHPSYPKSHLDILNLALLGAQLLAFWFLPRATARTAFLLYFAFWRLAYNLGLGIVLTKQSKRRWMVKQVRQRGWLDPARRPAVRNWIRKQLQGKMGADYKFDVRGGSLSRLNTLTCAYSRTCRSSITPGSSSASLSILSSSSELRGLRLYR